MGSIPATFPNSTNPSSPAIYDCVWLLRLAEPGINGHAGIAHGGVVAAILDEVGGDVCNLYKPDRCISMYTVKFDITYKSPVTVPDNYVCVSWLSRKQGRQYWVVAQVLDEKGVVKALADILYIASKTQEKL